MVRKLIVVKNGLGVKSQGWNHPLVYAVKRFLETKKLKGNQSALIYKLTAPYGFW